jgi:4-amino-4-deoxy-L-arabinose transferase-like glycosyltransferase
MMGVDRTLADTRNPAKWSFLVPVVIVLLGLFFRLYRLDDQSLWDDEVFSLSVSRLPINQMHPILVADVVHPPLHYYILHVWSQLVGSASFQARLLSVIFGTVAIAVLYMLAKYLLDRRTAILSAALFAVSQISIQFSQEARPYAQVSLLALCSTYLFIRALLERKALFWWLSIGSLLLTIQTHYFGSFLVPAFVAAAVVSRKEHRIPKSWWIGGTTLILASYVVWFSSGVLHQVLYGPKIARSLGKSFSEHWYSVFELVTVFNNGRADGIAAPVVPWSYLLGGVVFGIPALAALIPLFQRVEDASRRLRDSIAFLFLLCAIPVGLALVAGRVIRFYDARYIGYCAAPYYILVARGWSLFKLPAWRIPVIMVGLLYSIYALRAVYFIPYKQNYRDALAYVSAHSMTGDCYAYDSIAPLLRGTELRRAWDFFFQGGQREWAIKPVESVVRMPCQRVWFVTTWIAENPALAAAVRRDRAQLETDFTLTDVRSYYRVEVALYERDATRQSAVARHQTTRAVERLP